ncbi:N-ATPase subunit AtpR [Pinisolibacter sp.]|uniref:N-ATPase subunit AtpR n=1 Tax=Pinisolibacter sp. TaxID=2172024 RepID=UPI002FDCEA03
MTTVTTLGSPLLLAAAFAAGLALGLLHFASLRRIADVFAAGAAGRALALQATRWVVLVAVLILFARQGALPLLLTALGLFVARAVVLRRKEASS